MRITFFYILFLCVSAERVVAQCTTSDATSCQCEDGVSSDCDLLPDIKVGPPPLQMTGSSGIIEYSQTGNGSNNGRLRISVSTPNIGHGPLTVRSTSTFVCGQDTFYNTSPGICQDGSIPKQLIIQRVYHKSGTVMTYYDRPAGSMTYHPGHGHMHVDDWGVYTLRTEDKSEPDPLKWPVVGTGAKLAFCLMDYGSCSTYNGHCLDDQGNVMTNNDFPNYGLGGGSYNCSNIEQGISSGWTDIYHQYLDGMWIDIPPGTCNGDYYIVVELDPYDYFLEENETNNVFVAPVTLQYQVPVGGMASVSNIGPTDVCPGDTVTLIANNGLAYVWSTGHTSQSIQVTGSGSYQVTVTSNCGTTVSQPVTVNHLNVSGPVGTGDTVCVNNSAILHASSLTGPVRWFDDPVAGNLLHTGQVFTTPPLAGTTVYYTETEEVFPGIVTYLQPHDTTIGDGDIHTNQNRYLVFDANSYMELVSVKVFAAGSGNRIIELRDQGNNLLQSKTVMIPDGESRVLLNFSISPGTGYRLGVGSTPNLYRNNSGVNYPYSIAGLVDIINSSAGPSYYYFFYDWEVSEPDLTCVSARNAIEVFVDNCVGISEAYADDFELKLHPNPAGDVLYIICMGADSDRIDIRITDLHGRAVIVRNVDFTTAGRQFSIDTSMLSGGVYFLHCVSGDLTAQRRFVRL